MDERDAKIAVRRRILAIRDALSPEVVAAASVEIVRRLTGLPEIRAAETLMVFLSFGSEVATDGLIRWGWAAGKRIVVPLCGAERRLIPCLIKGFEELEAGHYGIREPKAACRRPEAPDRIDAVLVPAVAFDRCGYRVGYGGGYYDRFLPTVPRAARIGAAWTGQIIAVAPVDSHDVPVDWIVTDEGVIACHAIRAAT